MQDTLFNFGEFENVKLSAVQYSRLVKRLKPNHAREYIEKLSTYIAQYTNPETGRVSGPAAKYKNHFAVITNWARRDGKIETEDYDGPVDEPSPEVLYLREQNKRHMRENWDLDAANHKHGPACQHGRVCRFVPSKRP